MTVRRERFVISSDGAFQAYNVGTDGAWWRSLDWQGATSGALVVQARYGVGFEQVRIPPGLYFRQEDDAMVFYPADGAGGELAELARPPPGGWPVIVLVHGLRPFEMPGALGPGVVADEEALCEGELGNGIDLFKRWRSTQEMFARAGYVSIAPALTSEPEPVSDAARWLVGDPDSRWEAPSTNPALVGIVGHSLGASSATNLRGFDVQATAVLAPAAELDSVPSPSLTIGSERDLNRPDDAFFDGVRSRPKHLVLFTPHAHFAYLDGLCSLPPKFVGPLGFPDEANPAQAAVQRTVTQQALLRFFDFYLLGSGSEDLGIERRGAITDSSPRIEYTPVLE